MSQADVLADDPFFRVVRQRHPEIDLVILPPATAPGPDEPRGDLTDARQLQSQVETVLADLADRLGPFAADAKVSWRLAAQSLRHQVSGRAVLATHDPVATLRRLGDTLLDLGWTAGPVDGATPRLEATRAGVRLVAAAQPHGVRVLAESAPLALTDEAVGALVR